MKVNVYDFDKTIYDGDSSLDFYLFCIKKNKLLLLNIIPVLISYFLYFINKKNKTEVKEVFFSFLKRVNNIDKTVDEFWNKNEYKIKDFYKSKEHLEDIIISASPEFLLKPICKKLKVKDLIASNVDKKTGKFLSINCKGKEKVKQLLKKYKKIKVVEMYTDSYSDQPLIDISQTAYIVKNNLITKIK